MGTSKIKQILLALSVAAVLAWKPDNSAFYSLYVERWGIVSILLAVYFIFQSKIHNIFKISLSYFAVMSLVSVFFYKEFQSGTDPELIDLLRVLPAVQMILLFCFLFFIQSNINIKRTLELSSAAVTVAILFSPHPETEVYWIHNPSMAGTFVVLASGCNVLSLFAVAFTHSWTAFLALSVGLLWRFKKEIGAWGFLALAVMIFLTLQEIRVPDNGRFSLWMDYFHWWSHTPKSVFWFGLGPGSTVVWLQYATTHPGITHWAHNDWLQIIFELGVFGIVLLAASTARLLFLLDDQDRGVLLAFGTAMCTDMVLHSPLTAATAWVLCQRAMRRQGQISVL